MEKILSWAVIGWNMRKPHSKICHNVRTRTDLILSFYTYDLVQPFILTVSNRIVQWWFMSKWIPPMISFISLSIPWSKFILIAGLTKFYSPIQRRNIAVPFQDDRFYCGIGETILQFYRTRNNALLLVQTASIMYINPYSSPPLYLPIHRVSCVSSVSEIPAVFWLISYINLGRLSLILNNMVHPSTYMWLTRYITVIIFSTSSGMKIIEWFSLRWHSKTQQQHHG